LSDDWRVWLKPFAPEPPAKEDVKQRVRQELAKAEKAGVAVRDLKSVVTRETGAATDEVVRAVVELANDNEAVVEQGDARHPDDGALSGGILSNDAQVWLKESAPPDDRKARTRILELVQDAGEEGILWANVVAHLEAEGVPAPARDRAVQRLMADVNGIVECYDQDSQMVIRERSLLNPATILRLRKEMPPPSPPSGWKPFNIPIQPYRLPMSAELLISEFRTRVTEGTRITTVTFTARPADAADPLFGADEQAKLLAQVQAEHKLTWTFRQPISKDALLNLVSNLLDALKDKGEVTIEATVNGEVPSDGD